VVAGDSGGAPDAVLEGKTGYVVGGCDVAAVAERITRLLSDDTLRRTMGATGREWVSREWRWPILGERLRGLLQG
jgi:phosphatidylinositol alpha-1,6-mannosyltransferase